MPRSNAGWRAAAQISVALTAAILCFYGLGAHDLAWSDEVTHSHVAAAMHEHGGWWSPVIFETPYFGKPLPALWLMAVGYAVMGVSAFSSRCWSALFAVATVIVLQRLGERLYGVLGGWLAGIALATSYAFVYVHGARSANFDTMMIFSFVLTTYLFLRACDSGRGWTACAAAAALASYAKNFTGLVPMAVCVATLWLARVRHRPTRGQWISMAATFTAVHLAWMLPLTLMWGGSFIDVFVGRELIGKTLTRLPLATTLVRYAGTFVLGFYPWSLVGALGSCGVARDAWRKQSVSDTILVVWLITLAVCLVTVLPRAFNWYVIPAMPFAALAGARMLVSERRTERQARGLLALAVLSLILLPITPRHPFALEAYGLPHFRIPTVLPSLALIAFAVLGGAAIRVRDAGAIWASRERTATVGLFVLTAVALVGPPLGSVSYVNVYQRARARLLEASSRGGALAIVPYEDVVPKRRLTRHYFDDLPNFTKEYRADGEAALELARQAPAPSFVLISTRGGAEYRRPNGEPGRLLFSEIEPGPFGEQAERVSIYQVR